MFIIYFKLLRRKYSEYVLRGTSGIGMLLGTSGATNAGRVLAFLQSTVKRNGTRNGKNFPTFLLSFPALLCSSCY